MLSFLVVLKRFLIYFFLLSSIGIDRIYKYDIPARNVLIRIPEFVDIYYADEERSGRALDLAELFCHHSEQFHAT
jgi:hypothetical protein